MKTKKLKPNQTQKQNKKSIWVTEPQPSSHHSHKLLIQNPSSDLHCSKPSLWLHSQPRLASLRLRCASPLSGCTLHHASPLSGCALRRSSPLFSFPISVLSICVSRHFRARSGVAGSGLRDQGSQVKERSMLGRKREFQNFLCDSNQSYCYKNALSYCEYNIIS